MAYARQKEYLIEQEQYEDYDEEDEEDGDEEHYKSYNYYEPSLPLEYYEKNPVDFSLKEVSFEFLPIQIR